MAEYLAVIVGFVICIVTAIGRGDDGRTKELGAP
jgi:hypothetical protein